MLSVKQNLRETIRLGHPDRFVNQYEYLELVLDPIHTHCGGFCTPGGSFTNDWGVTIFWPLGQPGPFPLLDDEHKLIKDITGWREILEKKLPDPSKFPDREWEAVYKQLENVDRKEKFVAPFSVNGLFEKLHYFCGMEDAMIAMYEEPEAVHDMLDFLVDWYLEAAKEEKRRYQPDALFQHDDWGTQDRMMISPEMFREFIKPAFSKIYHFWKEENGAEIVIHHSDSYAADVVPDMIDMGVDIWQGAVSENNLPLLCEKYGGKIAFHGGLDNGKLDKAGWKKEEITAALTDLIEKTRGGKGLIPGMTMGGPGSTFPGVYEWASEEIDRLSSIYFK